MTKRKMSKYNDRCPRNFATTYIAAPVAHDSVVAGQWTLRVGPNDEWVSLFSVEALDYSTVDVFSTSVQDPENHECVEAFNMGAHYCLVTYTSIPDALFQLELRMLTGPEPAPGSANDTAGPAREDGAGGTAGPADEERRPSSSTWGPARPRSRRTAPPRPRPSWSTRPTWRCSTSSSMTTC